MSTDLRSGLIRLAFANPELRADLLPLIEKEAAGKQDKVRAVNDKGTVVWVNKDTLRKQPGKFKPYKHEEDTGKGGGAEAKSEGKKDEGGGKAKSPVPVKMYEYIGPDAVAIGKSIKDGVSLPPKKSQSVLGVLERAIEGVKSGKDSADPTVLKHYKSFAKHLKGEVDKRNKALAKHPQSVRDIANEHDLPAVDVAEVKAQAKSLTDKNAKSRKSPEQRKQEFLKNIDPSKYSPKELAAMKERIKKMSAGDFEKMVFALAEDEGGAEGGGKTASLRAGLIRLAYTNPELRPTLLPLIEKHAGEGDMAAVLEAEADPTSHDQNLPEHYYFGKTAEERLENIEKMLSQFASPASKDQNKPQSYYGLPPKGKQASGERTAMDFPSEEALKQYLRDHPHADKKNHKVRKDTTYEKHHAKVQGAVEDKFNDVTKHLSDAGLSEDEAFSDSELSSLGNKWYMATKVKLNDAKKSADREKLNAAEKEMGDIANKMKARITELAKAKKGKQASTSKVAANYDPTDGDFNEQEAVRDEIVAALAKKFKGVKDSASLNAFDVGNNHYSLHGEWVAGHDNDLKTRIQVPTRAKYVAAIVKAVVDAEKGGKQASVKTAGGSGAANAAFLRQSPLKNKILQAVAKHYGTSVAAIEAELTDPDAEAVFEYIGNDAALQMQVYREFKSKGYR